MPKNIRRRKCKHCRKLFYPDPRNEKRQKYCSEPECRIASKKASQRRWLGKTKNRDYFSGPTQVIRVQQWREKNPGYWKKRCLKKDALQETLSGDSNKYQHVNLELNPSALQDLLIEQHTVLFGLIAHLTGNALQDSIALTARHLKELGRDFLQQDPFFKGGCHDQEVSGMSKTHSKDSPIVQLGGSSPGS